MNAFIDIMEKVTTKDSAGFATPSYNIVASVRAYKEERNGGNRRWEQWTNMAAFSSVTAMFRFRVIPNLKITSKHFISDGENIYNIINAEDVRGRGMYVEVLAETVEGSIM